MYEGIIDVQSTDEYELILSFDNSEKRLFDVKPYFDFGRFSELKNIEVFKKVHVSFDTVEWDNGLDLDPEFLYTKSKPIDQ